MSRGMDLLQVNVINFCFMIAVFLLEIPTGAFADTLGRKCSFVLSCFIISLGLFIYFFSTSFWFFVLAEIVIALGAAFYSGAFQSWLVDSLKYYNFQGSLSKVFSTEQQLCNIARIVGGLTGAYVARNNLALSWLVAAIGTFGVGILAQIIMKESYFQKKNFGARKVREGLISIKTTAASSIKYGVKNKVVFMIVCLGLIQCFSVQALNMYWQPRFNKFLPSRSLLGWIYVAIWLAIISGNKMVGVLLKWVKRERLGLLISQVVIGLGICLASLFSSLFAIFLPFIIHEIGRGMFTPIKSAYLNKNIPSAQRATVISFDSMVLCLGSAIGLLISGVLAKNISIPFAWLFSGIFLVLATVTIYLFSRKRN
jgi:MFS family permease